MSKILCVTSDPISLDNANGKFVRNYLYSFTPKELYNFYISCKKKDEDIESFNITDSTALKSIFKTKQCLKNETKNATNKTAKKNPFKHICRYFVWNLGCWKKAGFKVWIDSIKPEHLITTITDNPYLLKLTLKIAKKFNADITLLIGENYPIKKYNYITKKNKMSLMYRFFKFLMLKQTKKIIKKAKSVIFNSELIKEQYLNCFNIKKSYVFYPPADEIFIKNRHINKNTILYAGNLGVGRLNALIDFAKEIYNFNQNLKIQLYSSLDNCVLSKLNKCKNIEYKGYVSNDELNNILLNSELLIHIESFEEYYKKDLETAFSTKISNNIYYGNKFLLYAPQELAESKFYKKHCPNNYISNKAELLNKIRKIYNKNIIIDEKVLKILDIKETGQKIKDIILR